MISQSRNYLIGFIDFPLIYEALRGVNAKCRELWAYLFAPGCEKTNRILKRKLKNSGKTNWEVGMTLAGHFRSAVGVGNTHMLSGKVLYLLFSELLYGFAKNESWGRRLSLYFPWS